MSNLRIVSGLAIAASLTAVQANAQSMAVVGAQHQVNPSGQEWQECSIGARLENANEVVVAAMRAGGGAYGISLDGGQTFSNGELIWGMDPAVTVDPQTDRLWITELGSDSICQSEGLFCISGAWKEPGATALDPDDRYRFIESCKFLDRPTLRVLSSGRHLLTFVRASDDFGCSDPQPPCQLAAWSGYSDTPYDKQSWPDVHQNRVEPYDNGANCPWEGWGATPVELEGGRIVVVVRDHNGLYNNDLPYVVYSDDGGNDWKPENLEQLPVRVGDGAGIVTTTTGGGVGDTPFPIDHRARAPGIAVNRWVSPNEFYVVFYARSLPNDTSPGDRNSDIYLAKGFVDEQGDLSFPTDDQHLLQITDAMLGLTTEDDGPDQVMPSIAIDPCGGINLVFYDNREDKHRENSTHRLDLYYVRITDFGPAPHIQQVCLTAHPFQVMDSYADFLGHYHHMTLGGPRPTVYPAYIALDDNGVRNCYVNKISIVCSAELSAYSEGKEDACTLFERLCEDKTIDGDLNGDGLVDDEDAVMFAEMIASVR